MSTFYGAIDCFVLSTNWEGLPTVVLEAMAYQKPVLCTNVGGINEAIQNGENGYLISATSARDFATRMIDVAQNKSLADRFVENGLVTVRDKFGPVRFSQQVRNLYSNLLSPPR